MKRLFTFILALSLTFSTTGCATILGGPVTASQKTKPGPGEQQRSVRTGWLIVDIILFAPGLIVDFATGAIYKK
ncbi:MAG: hypothetical protein DA407_15540 [Bacteroidetes bacterium]|jgi:hypothetical protein|nr:MAG: hypothetical protein DA407_15540 [Bacteroidota bacterium]